jgi:hypothetical protein
VWEYKLIATTWYHAVICHLPLCMFLFCKPSLCYMHSQKVMRCQQHLLMVQSFMISKAAAQGTSAATPALPCNGQQCTLPALTAPATHWPPPPAACFH